jgi:hypothetical protein
MGRFITPGRGGEQRADVSTQHAGEAGNHRRVRQTAAVLPTSHRGTGHVDLLRQFPLRKPLFQSQFLQRLREKHIRHNVSLLLLQY